MEICDNYWLCHPSGSHSPSEAFICLSHDIEQIEGFFTPLSLFKTVHEEGLEGVQAEYVLC